MSAVTALHAADARLASQIDTLTAAVQGVGSLTAAARERLAVALDAARDYLNATVREIAAVVGLTVDAFDIAAGCELLDVPADEPIVVHVDPEAVSGGDRPPDATPGDATGIPEEPSRPAVTDSYPDTVRDALAAGVSEFVGHANAEKDMDDGVTKEVVALTQPEPAVATVSAEQQWYEAGAARRMGEVSIGYGPPANGKPAKKSRKRK